MLGFCIIELPMFFPEVAEVDADNGIVRKIKE